MNTQIEKLSTRLARIRGKRFVLQHTPITPGVATAKERIAERHRFRLIEKLATKEAKLAQRLERLHVQELEEHLLELNR